MGRPRIILDEKHLENLASVFCTTEEIAAMMGCSKDTIERNYSEALERGRNKAKSSLRVVQYNLAKKNAAMAIFLGKNYLGQRDRVDYAKYTDEELLAEAKRLFGFGADAPPPDPEPDNEPPDTDPVLPAV